jgi:hypothetical protein
MEKMMIGSHQEGGKEGLKEERNEKEMETKYSN